MENYKVTFERSNEGIPTLVVSRESYFALMPGSDIVRVITGSDAERIWYELGGREAKANDGGMKVSCEVKADDN